MEGTSKMKNIKNNLRQYKEHIRLGAMLPLGGLGSMINPEMIGLPLFIIQVTCFVIMFYIGWDYE
jgi:hypothetical protein